MANGLEKAVTACVGLGALALGVPLPPGVVETAVGVAGLTEFVAEKNQKFGPECARVRAKTRKAVREGFAEFLQVEGDTWTAGEDLTAADAALAKHLGSCVMDRERLAEDFVSKGFPGVAVDRLMGELAGHEPELFGAEATGSVSHRYARRVLEVSLRAVVENREYYEALEPYIIWKMGLALGILVEHAETTLKLLNDMADAIERLERKANRPDLTRAQSLGFARTILEREVPDDQLEAALFEITKNFFTMRTEIEALKGLSNEAPDILPHLEAAQAALEREDMVELEAAEVELREVRRIYEAGIAARRAREDARRAEEDRHRRAEDGTRARIAETLASAAAARLDRRGAAQHYGEAAALWPEGSRERLVAFVAQGDLLTVAGDTTGAATAFQAALDVAERLARDDPSSAANARDLSVSLDRIGNVRRDQGNLAEALGAYTQGMEIAERLMKDDPSSAANARGLSVNLNKIGDVRSAQGNLAEALEAYTRGMKIAERRLEADPSSAEYARDLSVSLERIGDVHRDQGNLAEALGAYTSAMEIAERLVEADPSGAANARDLFVSLSKIGDVRRAQGSLAEALETWTRGMEIAERLVEADPSSAEYVRDLSVSLERIGDVRRDQGNLTEALGVYTRGMEIAERLARDDPSSAANARDLSVSLTRIGDVRSAQGNLAEALGVYTRGMEIAERLARDDPSSAANARDLSVSLERIGDVRRDQGKLAEAFEAYTRGMEIRKRLARDDPSSAANALSVSLERIGDVRRDQGKLAEAFEAYTRGMEIAERLAQADPSNADWARDVVVSYWKLARVDTENAVAHWREVVARLGAMREAGILRPVDEGLIADAEEKLRGALEGRG